MTGTTPLAVDREAIAAVALRRCGAWCRRKAGARWRQWADPDWEQVAVLAAFHVATRSRPGGDGMPHGRFVAACCPGALSDLTRTARRRAAAGFDAAALRVPLDPDTLDPRASEPWVGAAINEGRRA